MNDRNIRLILAYDGSRYHGWQRQKNGISIQEVIEEKLEMMVNAPVKLFASGRTDAGVHAKNQVCNFVNPSNITPDAIKRGLNSLLPEDIHVKTAEYVPEEFHARYSAKGKVYEYGILNQEERDVFLAPYHWHIRIPLDWGRMAECLSALEGTHDFSSFKASGSDNTNPVRTINKAQIQGPFEDNTLRITIEADGFLRHMVRNIVGTVVEVGMGKMGVAEFKGIVSSKDRRNAGIKAPAHGLFLVQVFY